MKLLKPVAVYVRLSEKSLLDMIWIVGPSQRINAKSKPGIQWVDLVTLPKTDSSVSSEVVEMSSHQASVRFNHNTQ